MRLSEIKNEILKMDYSPYNIKTYVVFVPVLSLIVKKIQMAYLLPFINKIPTQQVVKDHNDKVSRYNKVSNWHYLGMGAQVATITAVLVTVVHAVSMTNFALLAALPIFYALYSFIDCLRDVTRSALFYEFDPDGNIKRTSLKPLK